MVKFAFCLVVAAIGANSCGPKKPPCEPVAAVKARWQAEARTLVDSGACDPYDRLSECPEWTALEALWAGRQAAEESKCQ